MKNNIIGIFKLINEARSIVNYLISVNLDLVKYDRYLEILKELKVYGIDLYF